jgi:hypothetical protein
MGWEEFLDGVFGFIQLRLSDNLDLYAELG